MTLAKALTHRRADIRAQARKRKALHEQLRSELESLGKLRSPLPRVVPDGRMNRATSPWWVGS